jgi:hypothetical protein
VANRDKGKERRIIRLKKEYDVVRKSELLRRFDEESQYWRPAIVGRFGRRVADTVLREAYEEFEALIPQIPYIGGDENHLTESLIGSVRYLALYKAMKKHGNTAEETGKILYDAILTRIDEPRVAIPSSQRLTTEQLMERRRKRAERSQERRYPQDYVYEFVAGDGEEFDYGYDFSECAAQKFYHAQGADEFMPFYCYLDFPESRLDGSGLSRTMTLAEGHEKCNHRFKKGREAKLEWPPPFLKGE